MGQAVVKTKEVHKVKVLIVDDEPDLRELLILLVESYLPIEFKEAGSGKEAIGIIEKNNFDLILCDFNMPSGNGKLVFDFIQKMNIKPSYILITSDDAKEHSDITSQSGIGYVQKPFDETILMDSIYKTLSITPSAKMMDDYLPLGVNTAFKLSPFPYEYFVRLGENHFIKYFNSNTKMTDKDLEKLRLRKVDEIYVKNNELRTYIAGMQRTAFESLILNDSGISHPFEVATVHNDLIHLGLKGIISDKELVELSQKNLKTVFANTIKVPVFKNLISWVENEEASSSKLHATILTMFCNIILKNLNEPNLHPKASLILTYASVLHDINLNDFFIKNEWRLLQGIKINSSINKDEQDVLSNHVIEVGEIIKGWVHCPIEVIKIIEQHHEWPNGKGFPLKLTGDQISDLSAIFIVAHEAAALIWERKEQEDFLKIMAKFRSDMMGFDHFLKPLEILIKELT